MNKFKSFLSESYYDRFEEVVSYFRVYDGREVHNTYDIEYVFDSKKDAKNALDDVRTLQRDYIIELTNKTIKVREN